MSEATVEAISPDAADRGNMYGEMLVGLALLQMLLFGLNPIISVAQVPVEIMLFLGLIFALRTSSLEFTEIMLIGLCTVVTAMSFFNTPFEIFLVNAKQNFLAVLSLIVFTKIRFSSNLILPTLIVTLLLLVIAKIDFATILPMVTFSAEPAFNKSRFGGLFLNAHFNAMFLAVAFVFFRRRVHLLGLDFAAVYISASKFVILSYVVQVTFSKIPPSFLKKYNLVLWLGFATAIVLILLNSVAVIDMFNSDYLSSGRIILMQIVDPAYYQPLWNLLPSGYIEIIPSKSAMISSTARELSAWHNGHNEIGYFSLATQSGAILASLYLMMLIRRARHYAPLILVSLLHNVMILSPLIIYMMVSYSGEIDGPLDNKRSNVD